jgi:hypothetical protein
MIDKRPALLVRAAGVADVIQAIEFARDSGLVIAVRGGGHNVSGNAVCDGGLTLDLSLMRSVRVDPKRQSLRAEGGTLWRDLDREAEAFGLATTGGLISSTGIAGLTLGGLGWLMGSYGLACDNLLSLDLVTAAGELVTASASENADLFWGLRGGGGNFGVATSLEYRVHPVGPMLGGLIIHPLERAGDLFRFYEAFTRDAPDALGSMLLFVSLPDGARIVAIAVCCNGPVEAGQALLAPLRPSARHWLIPSHLCATRKSSKCSTKAFPPDCRTTGVRASSIISIAMPSRRSSSDSGKRPHPSARSPSSNWGARWLGFRLTIRRSITARRASIC